MSILANWTHSTSAFPVIQHAPRGSVVFLGCIFAATECGDPLTPQIKRVTKVRSVGWKVFMVKECQRGERDF